MNKSTKDVTIYHNPRCSKSRQTLALIEGQGIQPEIVLYLDNPPSAEKLQQLLKALDLSAEQLSETELMRAMCTHPILIERPIVECNNRACIGQPPESVLEFL